jgi:hypothetical protein
LRFSHHATSTPTNQIRSNIKQELCAMKPKGKSRLVANYFKFLFSRIISQFPQAMFDHAKC